MLFPFNGNQADCDGVFGPNSKRSLQSYLHVAADGDFGPVSTGGGGAEDDIPF